MVPTIEVRHPWRLARFAAAAVLILMRYFGVTFTDVSYWWLSSLAWGPYALAFASFFLRGFGVACSQSAELSSGLANQFDGRNHLRLEEEIAREAMRRDRAELRKHGKGWPPGEGGPPEDE